MMEYRLSLKDVKAKTVYPLGEDFKGSSKAGNKNLRRFVELYAKQGLYVILRVGPFDRGEVRNEEVKAYIGELKKVEVQQVYEISIA